MAVLTVDIELRHSGTGDNGLGGAIGNTVNQTNTVNNIFNTVTSQQAVDGLIDYRCVYLKNANATSDWDNVKMFFDDVPPAGITMEVGVGTAAVNASEQTISSAIEIPSGVTFYTATNAATGVPSTALTIPANSYKSFWLKRTISPNQVSANTNAFVIGAIGDTI